MKRVVCKRPGEMALETAEKPSPGKSEVLVGIKRIGLCGTDIHAYSGNQPYFKYPRVLGHELAGVVESVGEGVTAVEPGTTVYVMPYIECGECIACRKGRTNCCTNMSVLGVHKDGGMCEYLSVPQSHVIKAEGLDLDQLALVECMAIGAHAVRRADVQPGTTVAVVGAGPIGMGIVQFAKARGARVIVVDMNQDRLKFCQKTLGAAATIPGDSDVAAELDKLTNGDFPEVVFEATGNPKAMMAGFKWTAHAGKYVLVSVVNADITFNDPEFHKRELSLLGSRNATTEDFEHVVRCLQDGVILSTEMVTHRCNLDELPQTMPGWIQPTSGIIKAIVEVN
ncbi:zinc-binding alcohol dehydrogenase family protein [Natronospirillum operosum]|uniref:Zinc-binding alcohol dehydrogenase family protein n=1 Tax=Natronospirillum operosum TaxID=2759953 RepID=A0A4Z0WFZ4_9GAMM|nr:zinc-binding alcohol dehydrogenase family protein [Natronospirillum operosum]TGG93410.1 zinc-binding alcohol dehydrogenase family protein [Natronospirillum operosum]